MNRFFKHLSLSILLLSLFAVTHNQCMHIKRFSKLNHFVLKQNSKKILIQMLCSTKQNKEDKEPSKLKWGPIEDLKDFTPVTHLPSVPAEPWSYEKTQELSIDQALYGLKQLEQRHKFLLEQQLIDERLLKDADLELEELHKGTDDLHKKTDDLYRRVGALYKRISKLGERHRKLDNLKKDHNE